MGEARRRKLSDPNYGMQKHYMSYLELPFSEAVVTQAELKGMIRSLRDWTIVSPVYCTILHDHTQRWKKIEKLCRALNLEKIVDHNPKLYGTQTVYISRVMEHDCKTRIATFYLRLNQHGYPSPPAPPSKKTVKMILEDSDERCKDYKEASDIKTIYASENCVAFEIPSDLDELRGFLHIDFFVKQRLSNQA